MKKILAFCLFKYFPDGGLQRDFLQIALKCQERGFEIRVYTLSWEGACPAGFDLRIVPVKAFRNHTRVRKYSRWLKSELERDPVYGTVGFNKIPNLDIYYAADVCYREKSFQKHNFLYRLTGRYRQYEAFEKSVFGAESRTEILMISKAQKEIFIRHYGTPPQRMHFLPPNVSPSRKAPPNADQIRREFRQEINLAEDEYLLIQVGSGFKTKGLDRSIRAIAALPTQLRKKIRFWVIGNDHPKRFQRLARRLGISEQVSFSGARDDIPPILLAADLMIHPAYHENTGTVLLEALVAGLPVLCTQTCGYSHHISDAGCGIIVPEPFLQSTLNKQLEELLVGGNLPELQENALAYAASQNLSEMPEVAVEKISECLTKKDKRSDEL